MVLYIHRRPIKELLVEVKRQDSATQTIRASIAASADELALALSQRNLLPVVQRRPSEVLSSAGIISTTLKQAVGELADELPCANDSTNTPVGELTHGLRWMIPKFESFEATTWMMGPFFIVVRLVQTGFAALIPKQVSRLTFVACVTLGESKSAK